MDSLQTAVIRDVRQFNRFYTRTMGLLEETLTHSAFTLTEARVLFELAHRTASAVDSETANKGPTASAIASELALDPAYLTRILRKFTGAGLIRVQADDADRRRRILTLTETGEATIAELQRAADDDVGRLLQDVSDPELAQLQGAMRKVRALLGKGGTARAMPTLRPHRVGDIGWVVQRQALLYADEYGWDISFEALLAEIGAHFLADFQDGRDFCWIAELAGEPVGAVFLVHDKDPRVAKLRMLHVEATARGLGIGSQLVSACVEKARSVGYGKLILWTNDVLVAARAIYQRAGFRLVSEEAHHSFGKDLVGQTWELEL